MNYIVTAKPIHYPTSLDRSATRPVTPVGDDAASLSVARQRPSGHIYRGELLETVADKTYKPQYNLQISPENRRAINTYHKIVNQAPLVGRFLDGYI